MARTSHITGVEFRFPLVEQKERYLAIAGFITEVVGDAAIGIDIEEMLSQPLRQKPSCDRKIFVVGPGEAFAIRLRFLLGRGTRRDSVFGRQMAPDLVHSTHAEIQLVAVSS